MKEIKHILISIILILLSVSCEKDDNVILLPERIKQITEYDETGEGLNKYLFNYDLEQLVSVEIYVNKNNIWKELNKIEFIYNGNNIKKIGFYKEGDTWLKNYESDVLIDDGLVTKETFYKLENDNWIKYKEWNYKYENRNLLAWQLNILIDDTTEPSTKGEYIYENDRLIKYTKYGLDDFNNWDQIHKDTFLYSGANLKSWERKKKDWILNWQNEAKVVYSYSGDKIFKREVYSWDLGAWVLLIFSPKYYKYNSNGNIKEETNDSGYKKVYGYEDGMGNVKNLWYYPEELIYNEPVTTKSKGDYIPYYLSR